MTEPESSGLILVGRRWVATESTRKVVNPARTSEQVGRVGQADENAIDDAVAAASAAFEEWSRTGAETRAACFADAAARLRENTDSLVRLLVRENGKPLGEAAIDIARSIEMMDIAARDVPASSKPQLIEPGQPVWIRRRPRGVTAVISPWNSPVLLGFRRWVPAVAGGNTVVLKPASYCPLTLMESFRLLGPCFPVGVLNLLTGPGDVVGDQLVGDPRVTTIAFTGGTETGRRIVERSASTLKKLSLELGGNDPALVLENAVLDDTAIERMTRAILRATGQVCVAIKRIYVHRSRHDEITEKLADAFSRTVVGDGLNQETTMGPLNNKAQFDFVRGLIDEADRRGLKVKTYGRKLDPAGWDEGYFVQPTLITGGTHDDEIVGCEQFGPVIPIVPFEEDRQALAWANDTIYGLRASVWTADRARAERLADRIHAGAVFHNNHGIFGDLHIEFPGVKQSGLGHESRLMGFDFYVDSYGFAD